MFGFIFYLLMGFVSPSHSNANSKNDCKGAVTASRPGPGGETGNNAPR